MALTFSWEVLEENVVMKILILSIIPGTDIVTYVLTVIFLFPDELETDDLFTNQCVCVSSSVKER